MKRYYQIIKCDLKGGIGGHYKDCYLLTSPEIEVDSGLEIELSGDFCFNTEYKTTNRRLAGYTESFNELMEFCKEHDIEVPVECLAVPKELVSLGGKLQVGGERDYILNEKLVALGWSNDLVDDAFATNARNIEAICKTLSVGDYIKITIYDCCTGPCEVLEIYDGGIRVEMVENMYTLCYENDHLENRVLSAEYSEIAEISKVDKDSLLSGVCVNSFVEDEIYPLTIVSDRYTGVYSGGKYTAWNLSASELPDGIDGDDTECMAFWRNNTIPVGKGRTIGEALANLYVQLKNKKDDEKTISGEDFPW